MHEQDADPIPPSLDTLPDPPQLVLHGFGRPRLGDVTEHAELVHQRLVPGHRADEHRHIRRRRAAAQLLQHLPAVLRREDGLHHQQVGQDLHRLTHRFIAVPGVGHAEANALDLGGHSLAAGRIVLDDERQRKLHRLHRLTLFDRGWCGGAAA